MSDADDAPPSLVEWLRRRGLLRGPFLYVDYWSSVFRLDLPGTGRRKEAGLVDPDLFRVGLDRPDLEVPRLRHYLLLFLAGPFLLPFRSFRRLGRYRLSFRSEIAEQILERLERYALELSDPNESDRTDVRRDGTTLARDVLHPKHVSGFVSLFYATYKLPLASFTAIAIVGALMPLLYATGGLGPALDVWVPAGFPILAAALYLVWRDWMTAVLGALPVIIVPYLLLPLAGPQGTGGWTAFGVGLGGLFLVYLLVDWFFMPRPVPPVLLLYTRDGPGRAFDREEDAPWWLDGDSYWVWRYLMLTPAELNKFWERDWERVELWIRADGPSAGQLEWVVTDAHYREVWIPYWKLGRPGRLRKQDDAAHDAAAGGRPGFWLVEADADPIFHTPFLRAASFVPEEEGLPTRSLAHMLNALWKQAENDDPDDYRTAVDRVELQLGHALFPDAPEAASGLVSRHLLAQPWRYWRYPLGAATRRAARLYGTAASSRPPAADPRLQVKARAADDASGPADTPHFLDSSREDPS